MLHKALISMTKYILKLTKVNIYIEWHTVLPAKSDSDPMFCLQSYQGLIIDISLVH